MTEAFPDAASCRQACTALLARLPSGFLDRSSFEPQWIAALQSERPFDTGALLSILPHAESWPELLPLDETWPQIFLRTLTASAYQVTDASRQHLVAEIYPFGQFLTPGNGMACDAHQAVDGTVCRSDDPWWDGYFPIKIWGCRCTRQGLNLRMAKARGFKG